METSINPGRRLQIFEGKGSETELGFDLIHAGEAHRIGYWSQEGPLNPSSETPLVASLLPAMRWGAPITVEGLVSPRLMAAVPRIQEIFRIWNGKSRIVPVEATGTRSALAPGGRSVAAFFSAGVDSFYTALKHRHEIETLIFVRGFDVPVEDHSGTAEVLAGVRGAALALGKPLLEIVTDLRSFSDRRMKWPLYHGAALASVAHVLSLRFRKVFIPATHSFADLFPWGSHPIVDPLWSSESVEIVHDGCEVTRPEKIGALAGSEAAMSWLRVCWERRNEQYNCGTCEKCIRTMAALRIAGALTKARTFPSSLELSAISELRVSKMQTRSFWTEVMTEAQKQGDGPLAREVGRALDLWLRQNTRRRWYPARTLRSALRSIRRRARG